MCAVAYFTAVLARAGSGWRARDLEVEESGTLDGLADSLRAVAVDDQPVLAVVEHEDEWFALVRVDGEEEPRLFVSDLAAASRSGYAELLAPAADVEPMLDADEEAAEGDEEEGAEDEEDGDGEADQPALAVWAGEADLLEDLGVTGSALRRLVQDNADDPGAVLAEVGERVGFSELLEALR
jgi:putative tRNA adenosine deaminase-associated protein